MTLHVASQSLKCILLFMQFIILADYCLPTLSIMPLLSCVSLNQNPPGFFFSFRIHEYLYSSLAKHQHLKTIKPIFQSPENSCTHSHKIISLKLYLDKQYSSYTCTNLHNGPTVVFIIFPQFWFQLPLKHYRVPWLPRAQRKRVSGWLCKHAIWLLMRN